jgi:galactose mutarotase-like enzyme
MSCTIERSVFRGRKALRLSSGRYEAVFFTEFGAKLVSLRNRDTGYEFLHQGREAVHPLPGYGSLYVENDLCGADDLFPSINPSFYPYDPWRGTPCPPHGELWPLPWETAVGSSSVRFSVQGVRFPYRFQREVSLTGEGGEAVLSWDCTVVNTSGFDLYGIWAFHPLFRADSTTRIVLPAETRSIISTLDLHSRLGGVGSIHPWPVTADGQRLDTFQTDTGTCEKWYVREPLGEGTAALLRDEPGSSVSIAFDSDKIPYLGVWKNQGGLLGQNNIALEPATGLYDDLYAAAALNAVSCIKAGSSSAFSLSIRLF